MNSGTATAFPVGDVTYHGRNLTGVGEEGGMGVMAEGHGIGALRAINAWQRDLLGPCWHTREFHGHLKAEEVWIVVVPVCGCTPEQHAEHLADRKKAKRDWLDCDCTHPGLPPCSDELDWNFVYATADTPGAIPATEVLW